jgi:hypothetical protein
MSGPLRGRERNALPISSNPKKRLFIKHGNTVLILAELLFIPKTEQ